jgi:hypothetical protein
MTRILKVLAVSLLTLTASVASAHGAGAHAKGTVKRLAPQQLVVQTEGGETTFHVDATTRVIVGGAPGALADLRPGDPVVVHGTGSKGALHATEVRTAARRDAERAP